MLYRAVRPPRVNPSSQPRRILGEIEWWRVVPGQEPEPSLEQGSFDVNFLAQPFTATESEPSSLPLSPIVSQFVYTFDKLS